MVSPALQFRFDWRCLDPADLTRHQVLQKFFDNEREDYKKDVAMKTPNYDALQKKSSQAGSGE